MCVQEMLSPKVERPLSSRDKVLQQCEQSQPIGFDDLLCDRSFQSLYSWSTLQQWSPLFLLENYELSYNRKEIIEMNIRK